MVEYINKEKESSINPFLKENIMKIVENQIRDGNPKETKATLNRLMCLGFSREQAILKIGSIVAEEIYDILNKENCFNEKRYIKKLLNLH
jgi:hypothetical protein